MSKASEKAELKADAIKTLGRMGVKPGSSVYTSITHVSRSGMSRHVRCYIVTRNTSTDRDGKKRTEHGITDITGLVANALGWRRSRGSQWDLVVGGCGMDMGFHTVYTLARVMFPNGGDLKASNGVRQHQAKREGVTREVDGGYLLSHKSL